MFHSTIFPLRLQTHAPLQIRVLSTISLSLGHSSPLSSISVGACVFWPVPCPIPTARRLSNEAASVGHSPYRRQRQTAYVCVCSCVYVCVYVGLVCVYLTIYVCICARNGRLSLWMWREDGVLAIWTSPALREIGEQMKKDGCNLKLETGLWNSFML